MDSSRPWCESFVYSRHEEITIKTLRQIKNALLHVACKSLCGIASTTVHILEVLKSLVATQVWIHHVVVYCASAEKNSQPTASSHFFNRKENCSKCCNRYIWIQLCYTEKNDTIILMYITLYLIATVYSRDKLLALYLFIYAVTKHPWLIPYLLFSLLQVVIMEVCFALFFPASSKSDECTGRCKNEQGDCSTHKGGGTTSFFCQVTIPRIHDWVFGTHANILVASNAKKKWYRFIKFTVLPSVDHCGAPAMI